MPHNEIETYNSIQDLEQFGVFPLTGEACGLNMRILCDLDQQGCDLMRDFLRLSPFAQNWNGKGVHSCMLPISSFEDLWIFAQIKYGALEVFSGGFVFLKDLEETVDMYGNTFRFPKSHWRPNSYAIWSAEGVERIKNGLKNETFYVSRYFKEYQATRPLNNRHQMSGRTI